MVKKVLFTFVALAVLLSTISCAQHKPTNVERISVAEAERLVRTMFVKEIPDLNPAVEFPLTELTTNEIWQRLSAQVFQVNDGIYQFSTYLIKNERIVPLGTGIGGMGLTSMCVTDLDRNGNPELVYTYSWGSGIHRSQVAIYSTELPTSYTLDANISYRDDDWKIEKQDDQTVFLKINIDQQGESSLRLGQLVMEHQGDQVTLDIQLNDNLPPDVLERIWRPA